MHSRSEVRLQARHDVEHATDWDEIDTAVEFIRSLRGNRALKVVALNPTRTAAWLRE